MRLCARHRSCGSGLDRELFSETALSGNSASHIRGPSRHAAILQPMGLSLSATASIRIHDGPALSTPPKQSSHSRSRPLRGLVLALFAVETAPTEGWCLQVRSCARPPLFVGAVLTASFSAKPRYQVIPSSTSDVRPDTRRSSNHRPQPECNSVDGLYP